MGYIYNHLATLVCAVFAAVLTLLWPMFVDYADAYDVVFLLAVPIMWFLTLVCFVSQKSQDYAHGGHKPSKKSTKKSSKKQVYTADGRITS
tara:strand:+ start:773 stop:1045 length:273 start_codon:yes stop_codon:yes gene_type:complete